MENNKKQNNSNSTIFIGKKPANFYINLIKSKLLFGNFDITIRALGSNINLAVNLSLCYIYKNLIEIDNVKLFTVSSKIIDRKTNLPRCIDVSGIEIKMKRRIKEIIKEQTNEEVKDVKSL